MVTDRPYRRAMSRADALAELERCAGSQFDPRVVEAFRAVLAQPQRHLQALA
jgi:two-component system, cell cycle response regulator